MAQAAGVASKAFEHPFDLGESAQPSAAALCSTDLGLSPHPVKVRLQSQPFDRPLRFKGPWDCFLQTLRAEGLRGLYRGVSMPIAGAMAENATLFVSFSQTQALLRHLSPPPADSAGRGGDSSVPPPNVTQLSIAGAVAGAAASFVLTPVELVKCKMQVQNIISSEPPPPAGSAVGATASESRGGSSSLSATASTTAASQQQQQQARAPRPGAVAITSSILRADGFKGLFVGHTGTLVRETGGSAAWFTTFELCAQAFIDRRAARGERHTTETGQERKVNKGDLNALELMTAGAVAGVIYNCILFPADCIKSTMQTDDELRSASSSSSSSGAARAPRRTFLQVGKDIYNARGVRGLYSGCGLTALRAAPGSAIIFYMCVGSTV